MYFKLLLAIETVMSILFGIATIAVFIKLKEKNISKKYLYMFYVVGFILVCFLCGRLIPKYRDLKYLKNSDFFVYAGECEYAAKGTVNEVKYGGEFYKYNPYDFKPSQGEEYIIYYLPNSKFIIQYKKV